MAQMTDKFKKRLATALVGIPIVLLILFSGGWPFIVAMHILFFLTVWEWLGMVLKLPATPARGVWMVIGVTYFAFAFLAMAKLAMFHGLEYFLVLLLMVWTSDTTAYLTGKALGGPKLCPNISPNKTWSGLFGAMIGPALIGYGFTTLWPQEADPLHGWPYLLIGAFLGFTGQCGDLLISAFKRKVNVKDTSAILPGHGGVLDRIDALLLMALVYLAILTVYIAKAPITIPA